MQTPKQHGVNILFAIISLLLVLGGLSTVLAENKISNPAPIITKTSTATLEAGTTPTSSLIPSATAAVSPSATLTLLPPTSCPPPSGWIAYVVKIGDTLDSVATRYGTTPETLKEVNCLIRDALIPSTLIYVPPTATSTYIPCGPPASWVFYTVQSGDNLYRISLKYRVTVARLQLANCMGASTKITVGQKLYVPNVATSTPPIYTNTPSPPTSTPAPSATDSTAVATSTTTETSIAPSETNTSVPTSSPEPTATDTAEPTATD